MKICFILFGLFLFVGTIMALPRTENNKNYDMEITADSSRIITGTVLDADGNPVANPSVTGKNNGKGVIFASDGSFSIAVPIADARLQISAYYVDKIIVKGVVTDDKGNPLSGVSITAAKGMGTTTNDKGEYSLAVDENNKDCLSKIILKRPIRKNYLDASKYEPARWVQIAKNARLKSLTSLR